MIVPVAITQAAEQLSQLENLGIMACDLSQESFVINVTSLDLELSAGQAWQQSRPEEPRFHTIECPLGNSQCQACYLHRGDLEMSWLPEAQCSPDTGLCPGFDFVSQARVGFHRILAPLVSPLSGMEKLDAEARHPRPPCLPRSRCPLPPGWNPPFILASGHKPLRHRRASFPLPGQEKVVVSQALPSA